MPDAILVINAGSSSIKFSVFECLAGGGLTVTLRGQVSGIGTEPKFDVAGHHGRPVAPPLSGDGHDAAITAIHGWLLDRLGAETGLAAIGHRVVHGGERYSQPVLIDDQVIGELERLVPLAPLHQPHHLTAIRAMRAVARQVPQVACFDTAFHRNQPPLAQEFALPRALTEKGIRRYGFHGLSYEYIVSRLPVLAPECATGRLIIAHLGNGASLCAVANGRSVATTMGFTPVDGLVMGTRTGTLDPGVILYLIQHDGMSADAVQELIYERSGLLGVSGVSSDMRTLLASDMPAAKQAVDLFVYRISREVGSLTAALGGLDALVFTGGIGEHAPEIRARVCRGAAWLGVSIDEAANAAGGPRLSFAGARVAAWVVPTDENLMVARHTRRLLEALPHREA
jgi:acetate kinase